DPQGSACRIQFLNGYFVSLRVEIQQERFALARISGAKRRQSTPGATCPSASFSTCRFFSHSSVTPSRWAKAFLESWSTSVLLRSMPAFFISAAAERTAASAPETLGTQRRLEIAWKLSATLARMYFFSSDSR